jgi:hypothetical protein
LRLPGQPDEEWEAYVLWNHPEVVALEADDVEFRWVAPWDDDTERAARTLGLRLSVNH